MSRIISSVYDLLEECCELLHERTVMSLFTAGPSAKSGQVFLTSGDASNPGHDTSQCTPTNTAADMLKTTVSSSCQTVADTDPGGNVIQVCGHTIDIIALLNPAFGNTCG
jgi:hypothetical protein